MQLTLKAVMLIAFIFSARVSLAAEAPQADQSPQHDAPHVASIHDEAAIGYELDRFQNDFGVGLNVTSPYFAGGHFAVQAAWVHSWFDGVVDQKDGKDTWTPYNAYKLGFVAARDLTPNIRTYGVGGLLLLTPSSELSAKANQLGGYGAFGFEFLLPSRVSYFIEMGGVGTGAVADKLPTKPIYANGFLETAGFRVYL